MAHQNSNEPLADLTRPGQSNSAGDARALYLKLFSGEMFKGFQRNTIARDLVTKRTPKNGKSLQFIYTGRTTAEYHVPGRSILGNDDGAPPVAEKTITVDDLLISSAFVYELDETLAHYDLRGEISKKIGYALAEKYDRLIFRSIIKGARQRSPVQATNFEEPGGSQIRAPLNVSQTIDSEPPSLEFNNPHPQYNNNCNYAAAPAATAIENNDRRPSPDSNRLLPMHPNQSNGEAPKR